MADLSDVMNSLAAQIGSVLYPNGTSAPSANGVTTTIYPGWATATLFSDLQTMFNGIKNGQTPPGGRMHVSIYTGNVEQNVTKSLDGWQPIGTVANGMQSAAKEERRVKRQFVVTIYAPTPQLRDLTTSLIDTNLCSLRNLPLGDGSVGQVYYAGTFLDDMPDKEYAYRRTLTYAIEYPTFAKQPGYIVKTVTGGITDGFDPHNTIKTITVH